MKILDYVGLQGFWSRVKNYIDEGIALVNNTLSGKADSAALTNGSVTKVGNTTVGGTAKPIYLSSGVPTACSSTVGSASKPVYMSSGAITACSSTVGSGTKPVYMSSGAITASSSSVGGTARPMYMSSGTLTACSSTVGSKSKPAYMSSGTVTECGYDFVNLPYLVLHGWVVNGGTTATLGWNASYTRVLLSSVAKSDLVLTRVKAGHVRIKIPTALANYITVGSAIVVVGGVGLNGGRVFAHSLTDTSGYITVYSYDASGTLADAGFWIQVYFIPSSYPTAE